MVTNLHSELTILVHTQRRIQSRVINLRAFCEKSENFTYGTHS